jgi:hypothetical protein
MADFRVLRGRKPCGPQEPYEVPCAARAIRRMLTKTASGKSVRSELRNNANRSCNEFGRMQLFLILTLVEKRV